MATRFLRREKALACPIHTAVRIEAAAMLNTNGRFSKETIIQRLNFEAVEDSIRWDYVREFLQQDYGCELVPLAASFFKKHKATEEHVNPGKFLAQGHGKKTAGFGAVIPQNDHLVIARVKQRKALVNGSIAKFKSWVLSIDEKRGTPMIEQQQPDQV